MRLDGSIELREHEGATRIAFSLDGSRFAVGDSSGRIVVRSAEDGRVLASAQAPRIGEWLKKPSITGIAWSHDGRWIATADNCVALRLRRADDLEIVSELEGLGAFDVITFGNGGGRAFIALAGRELHIRSLPDLSEIRTMPIERRRLDTFDVAAIACVPNRSLVVTVDSGGYSEDENDRRTDTDSPEIRLFDVETGEVSTFEPSDRETDVHWDPWRKRLYTVSYKNGTSVWSLDGKLLRRWLPYESRASGGYVPFGKHLAVTEDFLVTMPDRSARTKQTIDLWDPYSFSPISSTPYPPDEAGRLLGANHDGTLIVTPMRAGGSAFDHGIRLWRVSRSSWQTLP